MKAAGLPHSEIPGSKPVDGSPELIAVFRVLHSLLMPRHPSCARIRLAIRCSLPAFAPLGPDGPNSLASEAQSLFLPYEKFLALWRESLPADLVYELQFSFNFQLPVVKDRTRLRSESFGAVNRSSKEDARENSKRSCMPFKALMDFGGFHHLSPKGDVSLERR